MLDCASMRTAGRNFDLILGCDQIKNGYLRLETPFRYPDGSHIDVFLGSHNDLFNQSFLTDLGHTTAFLLDLRIKPWTTKRRQLVMADVCAALGVEQVGGELRVAVESVFDDRLIDALVRLAQACIRVADLAFTQRLRTPSGFQDDVEELVSSTELPYEQGVTLAGRFHKPVPVDFRVQGSRIATLILTLSSANPFAAHGLANEIFRKWYDLENQRSSYQFLSIFDSSSDVVREEDLDRLSNLSTVLAFPGQAEAIRSAISA